MTAGVARALVDRAAFIRAQTRLLQTPYVPEIVLHIADEATELWQKTEEELGEIGLPPPFWAFAWAGGQALARYILDNPEFVAGKTVLDFGSGSGLVAIAAAKAGAARVDACDIDGFAQDAMRLNAQANAVTIILRDDVRIGVDEGWDVAVAGDVSYERDMANAITGWLELLHRRGAGVLIGDPGRTYLARDRLTCVAEYRVPVSRALCGGFSREGPILGWRREAENSPPAGFRPQANSSRSQFRAPRRRALPARAVICAAGLPLCRSCSCSGVTVIGVAHSREMRGLWDLPLFADEIYYPD